MAKEKEKNETEETLTKEESSNLQPKIEETTNNEQESGAGTFRNQKTGRLSGITTKEGNTYLGLSSDDVNQIAQAERMKEMTPEGYPQFGEEKRIIRQQNQNIASFLPQENIIPPQPPALGKENRFLDVENQIQTTKLDFVDNISGFFDVVPSVSASSTETQAAPGTNIQDINPEKRISQTLPTDTKMELMGRNMAGISVEGRREKTLNVLEKIPGFATKQLPGVVGEVVQSGILSGLTDLDIFGLKIFREKAPFIQQSYNTLGELSTDIENDPVLTPEQKIEELQFNRQIIAQMGSLLDEAGIENAALKQSREYLDLRSDLYERERQTIAAMGNVRLQQLQQQFPGYNEQVLSQWVAGATDAELKKLRTKYKEDIRKFITEPLT